MTMNQDELTELKARVKAAGKNRFNDQVVYHEVMLLYVTALEEVADEHFSCCEPYCWGERTPEEEAEHEAWFQRFKAMCAKGGTVRFRRPVPFSADEHRGLIPSD